MTNYYSQNGWPAYPDTSHFVRKTFLGEGFWFASEDVATVFLELFSQLQPIESLLLGSVLDDWSWNFRTVRGSTGDLSNHASATAIDWNALIHVRGDHGTWTPAQIAKIDTILAGITDNAGRPVLRWGEHYTSPSTIDGMHFEINANSSLVAQAAIKIRNRDEDIVDGTSAQTIWNGLIKISDYQADIINATATPGATLLKGGDMVPFGDMVSYSTIGRRLELRLTEQATPAGRSFSTAVSADLAALTAQVAALTALVKAQSPTGI